MRRKRRGLLVLLVLLVSAVTVLVAINVRTSNKSAAKPPISDGASAHRPVRSTRPPRPDAPWLDSWRHDDIRVKGRVFLDGAPIAGATITLREQVAAVADVTAVSDREGRFDLGRVVPSSYEISATRDGATTEVQWLSPHHDNTSGPPDDLALHLTSCTRPLEGVVVDASGGAIGGARVGVGDTTIATSREDGSFRACLSPGLTFLAVRAHGYGGVVLYQELPVSVPLRISLAPEASVAGRVVRGDTGEPVSRALVTATGAFADQARMSGTTGQAVTDEQGRFEIAGLAAGRALFRVHASGLELERLGPVRKETVKAGEVLDDVVLTVNPIEIRSMKGLLTSNGRPIPDTYLECGQAGARSDQHGRFALDAALDCAITVPGHDVVSPERVDRATLDADALVVEVTARHVIRGRVLLDGVPAAGASVFASGPLGAQWYADGDGYFVMPVPRPGDYQVRAELPHLRAEGGPVPATAAATATDIAPVIVDLVRTQEPAEAAVSRMAGIVVDADGHPVADASVVMVGPTGEFHATSGVDGTFDASVAEGTYSVMVTAASGARGGARKVPARDGQRLVVQRPGRLTGTATGFATAPAIEVWPMDPGGQPASAAGVEFAFDQLTPGAYLVTARDGHDVDARRIEVAANVTSTVSLRPRGSGQVAGVLVDSRTRAPLQDWACRIDAADGGSAPFFNASTPVITGADGRFAFDQAPRGEAVVICEHGIGIGMVSEARELVEVPAAGRAEVTIAASAT